MNIKSSLYQILFQVYVELVPHVNYIKQLQYVDLEPHFQLTHYQDSYDTYINSIAKLFW